MQKISGRAAKISGVEALAGDASTRRYYRLQLESAPEQNSFASAVVMELAEPGAREGEDFSATLRFLESSGLPVPKLYGADEANGLLFLEDLGDATLESAIEGASEKEIRDLYRRAVRLIFDMQTRAAEKLTAPNEMNEMNEMNEKVPARSLRFDVEKLMWEFDFMLEHFVGGLREKKLPDEERENIRALFMPLCQTLAAQKPVFAHRDYHSRNLMVCADRLVMLDFQDARMGPCQYDLVSLLKDSYVDLGDSLRAELTEFYLELKEKRDGRPADRRLFYEVFDLMSIQRNLKAVGTFAFQSAKKNNARYLQYLPLTLEYVRKTLSARPQLNELGAALGRWIPELAQSEPEVPPAP